MNLTVFDLIADLIEKALVCKPYGTDLVITKEMSDELEEKAKTLIFREYDTEYDINSIKSDSRKNISSKIFNGIITSCKEENDFFLYRHVLCQLDLLVNINKLIGDLDFSALRGNDETKSFECLNSNADLTGIMIIPKVPAPQQTFCSKNDLGIKDERYRNSSFWYDNLNEHFNNIIYIQKSQLENYKISNVVIDAFKGEERDNITIGITPGCNLDLNDLLKVEKGYDKKTNRFYFRINGYKNEQQLNDIFLKVLEKAKEYDIDILVGSEMLGTPFLCDVNDWGFNSLYVNEQDFPRIIVPPSMWKNNTNSISIFYKNGEQIGRQYKQNPFGWRIGERMYMEDLCNSPKEILIIHVPGWGRLGFPICKDYIVQEYRDILVKKLKIDFIICPSFSKRIIQFLNASASDREFGVRTIWINSCAISKQDVSEGVGTVSVPVASIDSFEKSNQIIHPNCDGDCFDGCLFKIKIQLRNKDEKHCNEVEITHILPQK